MSVAKRFGGSEARAARAGGAALVPVRSPVFIDGRCTLKRGTLK
jgi:hypothetical protein